MKIFYKRLAFLCLFLLNSACTTLSYIDPEVPPTFSDSFSFCSGQDGGGALQISGSRLSASGFLEWVPNKSTLDLRVSDTMGRTLIWISGDGSDGFRIKSDRLGVKNRLTTRQGFLELDDFFLGIRYTEMGCILNFKWPVAWLDKITSSRIVRGSLKLSYSDDHRDISLNIGKYKECVKIEWDLYAGLVSTDVRACIDKANNILSFTGEDFIIEMIPDGK